MVKDTDNGPGVPGSDPVSDTNIFLIRTLARLYLWYGKTLSCEESESLVVRNPPKTVGPGLDWKEDFIVLRLAHWYGDKSAVAEDIYDWQGKLPKCHSPILMKLGNI